MGVVGVVAVTLGLWNSAVLEGRSGRDPSGRRVTGTITAPPPLLGIGVDSGEDGGLGVTTSSGTAGSVVAVIAVAGAEFSMVRNMRGLEELGEMSSSEEGKVSF